MEKDKKKMKGNTKIIKHIMIRELPKEIQKKEEELEVAVERRIRRENKILRKKIKIFKV